MKLWRLSFRTLVVCWLVGSVACSSDDGKSQSDGAATGGAEDSVEDTGSPRGAVRDLSSNCAGLDVREEARCSRAGLFCYDEHQRRCVCSIPSSSNPSDSPERGDRNRRGESEGSDAPSGLLWRCIDELPQNAQPNSGGALSSGGASSSGGGPMAGSQGQSDPEPALGGAR